MTALDNLRRLMGEVSTDAVHLCAELLAGLDGACEVLAPVADEDSPAGIAAGIAFQILTDLAASARPPAALDAEETVREAVRGFDRETLLLADAHARGRGENLDGSPRRETVPASTPPSAL